jgi:hypothetical protein
VGWTDATHILSSLFSKDARVQTGFPNLFCVMNPFSSLVRSMAFFPECLKYLKYIRWQKRSVIKKYCFQSNFDIVI